MGYQDNCRICGESYDSDNLMGCSQCGSDYCYRCGSNHRGVCERCGQARDASPPASPEPTPGAQDG